MQKQIDWEGSASRCPPVFEESCAKGEAVLFTFELRD